MPEQGNPEIARRRRVIGIWFWLLVLLSVATWVLIPPSHPGRLLFS
ncbi:hypothetical protein [Rhizobium leguminosarum]|nr:hypothetical protein [Rhizobium leguminosarum]